MKKFIGRHQKIKAICRVLLNHPAAFENKPQALAMKDNFIGHSDQISTLVARLLRPSSTIHRPKQDSQQKLLISLQEYIGMGILLATHLENKPLLDILKVYKSKLQNISAYKLYEVAVHVTEELTKYKTEAAEFGLTAELLTAFSEQVADFGETLSNTADLLTSRKSDWALLQKILLTCSLIIRRKLDPFIEFNEKSYPDLFKEYMLVRGSRKRRKKAKPETETCDISGTVTDSETGEPLANAIITLLLPETVVETDEDGYYLLDELQAGELTLTCHLPDYEVPPEAKVTAAAGESLAVDFSLKAIVPAEETPAA